MPLKDRIKRAELELNSNSELCACSQRDFIEIKYPDDQGNDFVHEEFEKCRNCGGKENPAFLAAYRERVLKVYGANLDA